MNVNFYRVIDVVRANANPLRIRLADFLAPIQPPAVTVVDLQIKAKCGRVIARGLLAEGGAL